MLVLRRIGYFVSQARPRRCQSSAGGPRGLLTLAIETSCDDTSVAVLEKPTKSEAANEGGDHTNGNLGLNSASSSEHDENEHWTPEYRAAHRSQAILHFHKKITANNSKYQGIHPMIALDSHQVNLANLVQEALQSLPPSIPNHHDTALPSGSISVYEPSGQRLKDKRKPDFVSVTRGPGMRASLSTGLDTAKGLAVACIGP